MHRYLEIVAIEYPLNYLYSDGNHLVSSYRNWESGPESKENWNRNDRNKDDTGHLRDL